MKLRRISIPAFVFLAVFTCYILRNEKTNEPRIVMIGPGYGLEINNGRALTALHVAERLDYTIIYADRAKDTAIIETGHANRYDLRFAISSDDFLFTVPAPRPGESGKPYITGGKVRGVIIGESGGRGIAAAFDEAILFKLDNRNGGQYE